MSLKPGEAKEMSNVELMAAAMRVIKTEKKKAHVNPSIITLATITRETLDRLERLEKSGTTDKL